MLCAAYVFFFFNDDLPISLRDVLHLLVLPENFCYTSPSLARGSNVSKDVAVILRNVSVIFARTFTALQIIFYGKCQLTNSRKGTGRNYYSTELNKITKVIYMCIVYIWQVSLSKIKHTNSILRDTIIL